ncbi:MAG TPA: hypothetical protein VEY09_09240 [Pyrinomonadaceae bacterium]|nr:hypothetical protein [Pyrinomonadaceae bacterium]
MAGGVRAGGGPPDGLDLQLRVGRLLGYGFALTLAPVGGLGSLAAFVLGLRALWLIRGSGVALAGKWLAWWCVAAGAAEALLILPGLIRLVATAGE